MRRLITLLFLALPIGLAALPARAAEAPVQASVGLTLIELPVPEGFVEPSRVLPAMRQLGERLTPPGNRLLAIFISGDDLALAQAAQPPAMRRYFMAQTLRQTESAAIPAADFAQIKTLLRQQYQALLDSVGPAVQGQLDRTTRELGRDAGVDGLSLKIGELKGLEVFDETATSISLLAVTKYAVQAGERTEEVPMAMAITTVTLKGKLVYLYAYAVYREAADLDWVRAVTRRWLPLAGAVNP